MFCHGILTFSRECAREIEAQDSLFGAQADSTPTLTLEKAEPISDRDKLSWEKELLGLYISGHPLDSHREKLEKRERDIKALKESLEDGMMTVIAGIVEESKPILTKKGEKMAFVRIADFGESIETVVFPRVFSQYHELLAPEQCVAVKGRLSSRGGEKSLIVEAVKAL